ncbi:uncharacterized protein LOC135489917 [Lineus longissimus]|uniref:uncharacterized protein LOC135489917 n=1 Tax=Lineus longissimus TaxID=88925 RepID=UPI00315D5F94
MAAPIESTDVLAEDKLVVLWPEYPSLYDVRSPDFRDRDQRQQAIKEIAEKIQRTGDWVKTRLRQLRNTFTRNNKPATSGSARKSLTKRTAWLMEKLQFLAPYVATRITTSNLQSRSSSPSSPSAPADDNSIVDYDDTDALVEDEDDDGALVNLTAPKSTKMPTRKRPKKGKDDEELKIMQSLASSISRSKEQATDDWTLFGQFVAESLRKLEGKTQYTAQHLINKVIFDAKMDLLNSNPQPLQQTQYPFPQQPQMFSSTQLPFPSGQQSQMLPPTIQSPMFPQTQPPQMFHQPLPQQHSNMPPFNTQESHQMFSQGEVSRNCQEQPRSFLGELNFAPQTTITPTNEEQNTPSLTPI